MFYLKVMNKKVFWISVGFILTFFLSCQPNQEDLVVFAAASLTDVLNEAKNEYELKHSEKIRYHFGGSQALAVELSKGSPGDVFISAGTPPMEYLSSKAVAKVEGITNITSNSLVLVTKDQNLELTDHSSLIGLNMLAIADPALAPAGVYAEYFLVNTGLWPLLEEKLILAGDVRAALNYVKSGNVDAAIVYLTDGLAEPDLQIKDIIPPESYPTISYPAAVVSDGVNILKARKFVDFLRSSEVNQLFYSYGFR